jgi:hypothetical protein
MKFVFTAIAVIVFTLAAFGYNGYRSYSERQGNTPTQALQQAGSSIVNAVNHGDYILATHPDEAVKDLKAGLKPTVILNDSPISVKCNVLQTEVLNHPMAKESYVESYMRQYDMTSLADIAMVIGVYTNPLAARSDTFQSDCAVSYLLAAHELERAINAKRAGSTQNQ